MHKNFLNFKVREEERKNCKEGLQNVIPDCVLRIKGQEQYTNIICSLLYLDSHA